MVKTYIPRPRPPLLLEAIQFDGYNGSEIERWVNGYAVDHGDPGDYDNAKLTAEWNYIQLVEETLDCGHNDWYVCKTGGKFFLLSPEEFELLYQETS